MPLRIARVRHWRVAILTAIGGYRVAFIAAAAKGYGPWFTITLTQLLVIAIFLAAYAGSITAALFGLSRVAREEKAAETMRFRDGSTAPDIPEAKAPRALLGIESHIIIAGD